MAGRRKPPRRGVFVTFEGIEGSGKTTQLARMKRHLQGRRVPVLVTRQPGGTPLGMVLRRLLLESSGSMDPRTELLLMFADRRQDLTQQIEPALAAGKVVLCDRYTDASRAYQGAGRRLGQDAVDDLHRRFCGRDPDRTYLFDLPVEEALARLSTRAGRDRIEKEGLAFHRRVRAAYRDRACREPRRFLVLDATRPATEVFETLVRDLDRLLSARRVA